MNCAMRCILFSICVLLNAAKMERLTADPRVEIRSFRSWGYGGYEAQFELVNRAKVPIVAWTVNGHYMELPGSGRVAYESVGCGDGHITRDLLPPGGVRHVRVRPGSCTTGPLRRITAIFADGTLAGSWSDVEELVKWLTIEQLVAQRWLASLGAIEADVDPVSRVGELVARLYRMEVRDLSWECRGGCWVRFREQPPARALEERANFYLSAYAGRLYQRLLRPGGPAWIYRRMARDEAAEKRLKSQSKVIELVRGTLSREIASVERDIDDLAWVTMFGPKGERVGPTEPPPPPQPREAPSPILKNRRGP